MTSGLKEPQGESLNRDGSAARVGRPSAAPEPKPDVFIFGVPFWNPSYEEFVAWWEAVLEAEERNGHCIVGANAYTLNNVWTNPDFRKAVEAALVRVNDGIGFRIASLMRGVAVKYNFNGTDLIPRLLHELRQPVRVFLYGAKEEVNAAVAERLTEQFDKVVIAGRINGFVDPVEEALPAIRASNADLVLVALGHPRQELFAVKHGPELNAKIVYPVGGLFDFLSGTKPRAPKWIRRLSFEWAYRLAFEPRRMFGRYVIGNPVFLTRSLMRTRADRANLHSSLRGRF